MSLDDLVKFHEGQVLASSGKSWSRQGVRAQFAGLVHEAHAHQPLRKFRRRLKIQYLPDGEHIGYDVL